MTSTIPRGPDRIPAQPVFSHVDAAEPVRPAGTTDEDVIPGMRFTAPSAPHAGRPSR